MIEVRCTLRCDGCGEAKTVNLPLVAQYASHSYPVQARTDATFVLDENKLPCGWRLIPGPKDALRCPRCNGVK